MVSGGGLVRVVPAGVCYVLGKLGKGKKEK